MHPLIRAVARPTVLAVNTPLATRRAREAFAQAPRPLRLEIGGLSAREGWVVTNVNPTTRLYLDATVRWPLEDGAAELVYADNVVEHLSLDAGRALLREAFRCLQPGGRIRLVTPDLGKHVAAYLRGEQAVGEDLAQAYRDLGLRIEHPVDLVRVSVESFGHHHGYVYDAAALQAEMERAGFVDVVHHEMGESEFPELRGLDQRTDEGPAQMALEARRP